LPADLHSFPTRRSSDLIWTWATALNNSGRIAGIYADATGTHSFVGAADGKTFTPFDVPDTGANQWGTPSGINDQGEIAGAGFSRSEEHTSELQSPDHLV